MPLVSINELHLQISYENCESSQFIELIGFIKFTIRINGIAVLLWKVKETLEKKPHFNVKVFSANFDRTRDVTWLQKCLIEHRH